MMTALRSAEPLRSRSPSPMASNLRQSVAVTPISLAAPAQVQTKLTVNTPGDKYEQEADRVAEQVMRMPEPQVQRQCACGKSSTEGECSECKKKKQQASGSLQRVASSPVGGTAAPPIVNSVLSSPGSALPTATRSFMESRFGQDFSHVRVHTDQRAAESAAAVQAKAYTVGSKIVFGQGEHPSRDQHLLAHELTHVVQQSPSSLWPRSHATPGHCPASPSVATNSMENPLLSRSPSSKGFDIENPATQGKIMEPVELEKWVAELQSAGYEVYTKDNFDGWLKKAFPHKNRRPDIVAVNPKTKTIIVGDVTAGPWSEASLRAGDKKPLPNDIGVHPDDMKQMHIEKTIDDATQLSRNVPEQLREYEVVAQDRYHTANGKSKPIVVKPHGKISSHAPGGGSGSSGSTHATPSTSSSKVDVKEPHVKMTEPKVHIKEPRVKVKGKGVLVGVIVGGITYLVTNDAYAATQSVNPLAETTDAVVGGKGAGQVAWGVVEDIWYFTPAGMVHATGQLAWDLNQALMAGSYFPVPEGWIPQIVAEGRNPFCALCHDSRGPLSEADRKRERTRILFDQFGFDSEPFGGGKEQEQEALRKYLEVQ